MTLALTVGLSASCLAIAMLLQGLEMLLAVRAKRFCDVWSYENLKTDLEAGLPLPHGVIQFIFSEKKLIWLFWWQIIFACCGLLTHHYVFFVGLFLLHLLTCIRFRGTFNGGSDMMIFVVLTGVLISLLSTNESGQKLGLIYIAIHGFYSYFKAGLVKVVHPDWRQGRAISVFLKRSLFTENQRVADWLDRHHDITFVMSWVVLTFELSIFLTLIFPNLMLFYFLAAIVFHFMIYLSFGLNRFFWSWLSAWPSMIFVSQFFL